MKVGVPYVLFETRAGRYGVDAYFSMRVERVERRATLIRKAEDLSPVDERPPLALLETDSLEGYLRALFETLYALSGESFNKRARHMRRWNIWRIIGIPTGHQRHIERDERLAKRNREALLALSILRKVLGVKGPSELEGAKIVPLGYAVFELEVKGGEVGDPVYRELFRVDYGAAMALSRLIIEEKKGLRP
ncbi:hypothetical protein CL1_1451 [Thermococcus cleftensis]|uniref:Uncharacterized protein n=1 Tax=Thermococcus cleftensis (strain DSM 27260 / KACC 17922 / CL1) TaxID=163003 RepID=I3ZVB6_THECF|nr:hypothetical protein [Thermococcus cleftensis]AFL95650.1 hypothetical protein CL1_1451 [Thermococcus cleftensis]